MRFKSFKLTIMTLLTVCLLAFGASSVSAANYIQWETEPNNSFETASRLISFNINNAINQGTLSSSFDKDYWVFDYGTASQYQIAIAPPTTDFYYVNVFQKINGSYHFLSTNFGGNGNNIFFTIPGLSSQGVVPEYYFEIGSASSSVSNNYYQIVVDPI